MREIQGGLSSGDIVHGITPAYAGNTFGLQ